MEILATKTQRKSKFSLLSIIMVLALAFGVLTAEQAKANGLNFSTVGTPSVSGIGTVGQTLTASTGNWSPAPTFAFQWQRNGSPIANATSPTYQIAGDDYGNYMSVLVTASRSGYTTTTRSSASQAIFVSQKGNLGVPPWPTPTGIMQVGEFVTIVNAGWDIGVTFTYQWFDGSRPIAGATSLFYQIPAALAGKRLTVAVTGSKVGFNPRTVLSTASEIVRPAVPRISWSPLYESLMGKNTLIMGSELAFGTTSRIQRWCFALNGSPVTWPSGRNGVYFVNASGQEISSYASRSGCYESATNIQNARIAIDVTNWRVGSHEITAITTDSNGTSSNKLNVSFTVAKTGPTVTLTSFPSAVSEVFRFTGFSATHSAKAPVKQWCLEVDGVPVSNVSKFEFKTATGLAQQAALNPSGNTPGCLVGLGSDLSTATIELDSRGFSNGMHSMIVRSLSSDGETSWYSDPVRVSFRAKNTYIPALTWAESNKIIVREGSLGRIRGSVVGNIPGPPPSIVVFAQGQNGIWKSISSIKNSYSFDASSRFSRNTKVRAVVLDEQGGELLIEESEILVSPLIKLAKPRIVVTGSTISDRKKKSVSVAVSSTKGRNATCSAKWAGGSSNFNLRNGAGIVRFNPSRSGTLSVTCVAEGMAPSRAVTVKY
jgi:hypothetical protein